MERGGEGRQLLLEVVCLLAVQALQASPGRQAPALLLQATNLAWLLRRPPPCPAPALPALPLPAVWTAMSVTGATAATFVAFIMPGLLTLRVAARTGAIGATSRALALVCVVLGLTMGTVTLLNTFVLKH